MPPPAVHRLERPVPPSAETLDGCRHRLLLGAHLAMDQDWSVGRRHVLDEPEEGLHGRAAAHQAMEEGQFR